MYPFNRHFRLKVLRLCFDDSWMGRYGRSIIKPEYFELDDEYDIADALLIYRETYGRCPKDVNDIVVLCNGMYEELLEQIQDIQIDNVQFVTDEVIQFAKEQAAKIAILESIDDVNSGNLQGPIERMKLALMVGENITKPGIDFMGDIDLWLYDLWSSKVRTGWYHIDKYLDGGLAAGELGVIMCPTNRGKTMALVNIGYGAAGIGSARNVVHFTHEIGESIVAKRYAARMIFRFPRRDDNMDEYAAELEYAARRLLPGKIRIISGVDSMAGIEQNIEVLQSDGFDMGLLIDDYADLVKPLRVYTEKRFELTDNYVNLRRLGEHHEIPTWTASQSTRSSLTKEVITVADIAEDIGKANTADIIAAICQTTEEENADQCRVFLAKVRDGERNAMFNAKYYGKQQAIVTIGQVIRGGIDA